MKAYPAYKDSGIEWLGEIPAGWKMVRLKHLLLDGKEGIKIGPFGSSLKSDIIKEEGFKVYGQENVIKDDFTAGHRYIDDDKFLELNGYELFPGDIVVTMMGTTGKSKVVPQDIEKGIMDSHLIRIRVNSIDFNPELLSLLINDSNYISIQTKLQSRGSIMEGLNSSIIKSLLVLVPSTSEQEQILAFIKHKTRLIDTYVAKKQQQIERLLAYRTALINQAVTKGLNPDAPMKDSGIECLGEIPAHWKRKRLKHLASVISKGTTPSTLGGNITDTGNVRFLKAENIINNQLSFLPEFFIDEETNELLKRSQLEENDILFVIAGATLGKVAILKKEYLPANTNQAVCFIRLNKGENVRFVWDWLQSSMIIGLTWLDAVQSAQPNLSMGRLGNFNIPYPPLQEQCAIVAYLDEQTAKIDTMIATTQHQIERLQAYRTSLISDAVTGKIDVRMENYTDYT